MAEAAPSPQGASKDTSLTEHSASGYVDGGLRAHTYSSHVVNSVPARRTQSPVFPSSVCFGCSLTFLSHLLNICVCGASAVQGQTYNVQLL